MVRLTVALALALWCAATHASVVPELERWTSELERITADLTTGSRDAATLGDLRTSLEDIRDAAAAYVASQRPVVAMLEDESEALGPQPDTGEPAEDTAVQLMREKRAAALSAAEGGLKAAALTRARAQRLLNELAGLRRQHAAEQVLSRSLPPLAPATLAKAWPEIVTGLAKARSAMSAWTVEGATQRKVAGTPVPLMVVIGALAIGAFVAMRLFLRRFGRDPANLAPTFVQAIRATVVVGAARGLLPTVVAVLIYLLVVYERPLTPPSREIADGLLLAFVFLTWVLAFFRASLSPVHPAWRILPVPDAFARGSNAIVAALTLAYALDIVARRVFSVYGVRLEVSALADYALTVVVSALLFVLLMRQRMWAPDDAPDRPPRWRALRLFAALALLTLPVIGLLGYVALARFIATQALLSGGLLVLLWVLHRIGREAIANVCAPGAWLGRQLRDALQADDEAVGRIVFWGSFVYDAMLTLGALPAGLLLWGVDRGELADWVHQLVFGLRIGGFTVSLAAVGSAILVAAVLLLATRLLQRVLAKQVLPQTRMEAGLRESIRTAVGYLGLVVALTAALAVLGIDFTNIAIVAGALSVGIGFGLQNIVNNFVSGLILLAERPVKAGDWIVIEGVEGHVKRISVRATEVQTLDRATVFVPNSDLIAKAVTNWTYSDRMGRVIVPVGVAYGSDTRLVQRVLSEIADAHPGVLQDPPPAALFRGFGDSSLDFELRCMLSDIESVVPVTSDLCFAIDERFRAAGVEIPFPQRDVHIRGDDSR